MNSCNKLDGASTSFILAVIVQKKGGIVVLTHVTIFLIFFFFFFSLASYKALDSTGASTATFLSEAAPSTQVRMLKCAHKSS